MDTANNLLDRLARLMTSVRDPKDVEELKIIRHQIDVIHSGHLATQKENHKVTVENLEMASKVKMLEQTIARLRVEGKEIVAEQDEFIEHLGVLFNRKSSGRYVRTPFCPKCRPSPSPARAARHLRRSCLQGSTT